MSQIDDAKAIHSGHWRLEAANEFGTDSVVFEVVVDGTPRKPPTPGMNLFEIGCINHTYVISRHEGMWYIVDGNSNIKYRYGIRWYQS